MSKDEEVKKSNKKVSNGGKEKKDKEMRRGRGERYTATPFFSTRGEFSTREGDDFRAS